MMYDCSHLKLMLNMVMVLFRQGTAAHYNTTGQALNAFFLSDDLNNHLAQEMDERTDKNRQTIAATLRLCFAARIN